LCPVSSPNGARVSGVVEETPGRLEYEVALYKEAPPTRVGNNSNSELPVDQAVPIGTKLQLRARINPDSGMLGRINPDSVSDGTLWKGKGAFALALN